MKHRWKSMRRQETPVAERDYRCNACYGWIRARARYRLCEWMRAAKLHTYRLHLWCGAWWWRDPPPKHAKKRRR